MDTVDIVRSYYNSVVEEEWRRIDNMPEFLLTCRYIDRYINPGDKVLDVGGGPGRYSLYLAEKGCDVTLFDLSDENVSFAANIAAMSGLAIKAVQGDARVVDITLCDMYDHVLIMGPLYHLLEESDRIKSVNACLNLLKPGGTIFASFISSFSGVIYLMKNAPEKLDSSPLESEFVTTIVEDRPITGTVFTENYFIRQRDVLPFMGRFQLDKLHFLGQEGVLSPCENNIVSQPKEVYDKWLDFSEKVCEREEYISWSEHFMYIGRKR